MTAKREAHARIMELYGTMSHGDMATVCGKLQAMYQNIIFFAPDSYHAVWPRTDKPGSFDSGPREAPSPLALFRDPEACFLRLVKEQLQYHRAPGVHMALRAPWRDEDASDDPMLRRGQMYSATQYILEDDPGFWRRKGRLLDVLFPPPDPLTEDAFDASENRWLRQPEYGGFTPADFGNSRILHRSMTGAIEARYNVSDPECAAFMRDARALFGKQKTTRIGLYAPATGAYLGPIKSRYRSSCGWDMLRWLCHHPNVFTSFTVLGKNTKGQEMRLAGRGPSPDFKAEMLLEEGLPIDDVEGLTADDNERLKRRFGRKRKIAARMGVRMAPRGKT